MVFKPLITGLVLFLMDVEIKSVFRKRREDLVIHRNLHFNQLFKERRKKLTVSLIPLLLAL